MGGQAACVVTAEFGLSMRRLAMHCPVMKTRGSTPVCSSRNSRYSAAASSTRRH